jgi:hypothetical protein
MEITWLFSPGPCQPDRQAFLLRDGKSFHLKNKKGKSALINCFIKREFPFEIQLFFMLCVFLLKLLYPSLGVKHFLLAGKEGVTFGTNINVYGILC